MPPGRVPNAHWRSSFSNAQNPANYSAQEVKLSEALRDCANSVLLSEIMARAREVVCLRMSSVTLEFALDRGWFPSMIPHALPNLVWRYILSRYHATCPCNGRWQLCICNVEP